MGWGTEKKKQGIRERDLKGVEENLANYVGYWIRWTEKSQNEGRGRRERKKEQWPWE